jgi:putative membrane protein
MLRKLEISIGKSIARILVIWIIQVVALVTVAFSLSGVMIDDLRTAVVAVAVIALLNAVLWPFLSYVFMPFAVFTLGFFTLLLNGFIIYLAQLLVSGFRISGIWTSVLVALGMTLITTILSGLLTIDDDSSYYRNVIRRRMRRAKKPITTAVPGVLFLEIDGLAAGVLETAVAEGRMPTLARWIEDGTHRIVKWECDLSSQTSASQAGILHGNNHDIVAFRWYDRKRGKIMASSDPDVLPLLEKERSNGNGLLAAGGASRGNMFSGDAPSVMYTASTLKDLSRLHTRDFYAFFVNPYNFIRTLLLSIWEIILEKHQFQRARRRDIRPRLGRDERGGLYPVVRAVTNVFLRDLTTYTLIGDMFAGVPSVYATFLGYDEVSHHSGVESSDALDVLAKLDKKFARLERASRQAPRPYRFVVLSDHGQSNGATFTQRYGGTFESFVQDLASDRYRVQGSVGTDEDWGYINAFLTETIHMQKEMISRPLRSIVQKRLSPDGTVVLGPEADPRKRTASTFDKDDVIVLASGNLGLIYFSGWRERLSLERIEEFFPGLIAGLAGHEGIGFIMAHSQERGPIVIGGEGSHVLDNGLVEGNDPLADFGENAAYHLRRTNSFPNAPDILVNSFCRPERNEVAALEEKIGSHGGLGGMQSKPFILIPAHWRTSREHIVGAEALYNELKAWLEQEQGAA